MNKFLCVMLIVCGFIWQSFAGVHWAWSGVIKGVMVTGDKLCFSVAGTREEAGQTKKFYVSTTGPGEKSTAAYIYQAYNNGWDLDIGWVDENPLDPGDGLCYPIIRIHTNGYYFLKNAWAFAFVLNSFIGN
ncbi:MAG: hypothetical protein JW915_23705 [Chitinispirillaceae bacterium]|nr:hypothetical protein [Chitinispirillaceae bacterium]